MSTEIIFYITIKDANIHAIADKLNKLDLTVFPWSIDTVGKEAFDPDHIMCSAIFVETEGIIGLTNARREALKKIDGIENVEIIHDKRQKEKRPWIPLAISTAVYALSTLVVLLGISRDFNLTLDLMTYLLYLVIPAIISFLSGMVTVKLLKQ